jgi:lipopolysaccharide assembly protein A
VRIALIVGTLALVAVLIFIIQNTSSVSINFLGAHLHVSLAVAILLGAVAGALVMAAAGTARITQLRHDIRRERRESRDRQPARDGGPDSSSAASHFRGASRSRSDLDR